MEAELPCRGASASCNDEMRRSISRLSRPAFAVMALSLSGCGTATLDLAGYPDAAHDRLYRDGRLGDDKGLVEFDLRKAWRAISDPAQHS
ncbi:MAG: hypothetical protein JWM91_3077 [Rhodospirillales bacterium]|nr:hypothetical protein [Rhodospirillales bacterium]